MFNTLVRNPIPQTGWLILEGQSGKCQVFHSNCFLAVNPAEKKWPGTGHATLESCVGAILSQVEPAPARGLGWKTFLANQCCISGELGPLYQALYSKGVGRNQTSTAKKYRARKQQKGQPHLVKYRTGYVQNSTHLD